jgi:hypothetical protein
LIDPFTKLKLMKTLEKMLLFTAALCLFLSLINCKGTKNSPEMITIPFTADFIGNYTFAGPDTLPNPKCADPFTAWRAIVDGKGTGTELGDFSMHFDFCGDSLSHYGNTYAFMVGDQGDTLFVSCAGQVIDGKLAEHPGYVISYWRDPFEILGGTGKFRGATGNGKTDDYNSSEDPNSHHHWTGNITMMKGKK